MLPSYLNQINNTSVGFRKWVEIFKQRLEISLGGQYEKHSTKSIHLKLKFKFIFRLLITYLLEVKI